MDSHQDDRTRRRIRVTGDILTAFSTIIDLPDDKSVDEVSTETEWMGDLVAQDLKLSRYRREQGLCIDDFIEVDDDGNDIDDGPPRRDQPATGHGA